MKRPRWVRPVEKPGYLLDDRVYDRFDARNTAFSVRGRPEGRRHDDRLREWAARELPGYSLRDRALVEGAGLIWRSHLGEGLYQWNPVLTAGPSRYGQGKWEESPRVMAQAIKAAALFLGAQLAGVCLLDRRHVYSHDHRGRPIIFEGLAPREDEESLVIPEDCTYAVALAVEMPLDTTLQAPDALSSAGVALGYSRMAFVAGSLAEFIRTLGYVAIPCGNDTALSVPIAIDAGLGELARTSRLITPEYGPNVRLAKVLTNMPLAVDPPIRFGVREFCTRCRICAEKCPAGAISLDRDPSRETRGPFNNPGYETWYEDASACLDHWHRATTGCAICVRVCPYTKPRGKPFHESVKAMASFWPSLSPLFAWADQLVGYGKRGNPSSWWGEEER